LDKLKVKVNISKVKLDKLKVWLTIKGL
jgi:hypothetical protein